MDGNSLFLLLIAGAVAYLLYSDARTGERSFVRFLLSLLIVYGPFATLTLLLAAEVIPFSIVWVFPLACAAAIWGLLCATNGTFAEKVDGWTYAVAPPVYDGMSVDDAISHFKKNGAETEDIFKYLVKERDISKEELVDVMERNFSDSELDDFRSSGLSK